MEGSVQFLGLDLASTMPFFLVLLATHVLAALLAIVSGVCAMFARKSGPRHGLAGKSYMGALLAVFLTACGLAPFRWPVDLPLVLLGGGAVLAAGYGFWFRQKRRAGDVPHIVAMSVSFVLMLTAFYVDNGPHLPLWQILPQWSFWIIPAVVGAPFITRASIKYRRRRNRQAPQSGA